MLESSHLAEAVQETRVPVILVIFFIFIVFNVIRAIIQAIKRALGEQQAAQSHARAAQAVSRPGAPPEEIQKFLQQVARQGRASPSPHRAAPTPAAATAAKTAYAPARPQKPHRKFRHPAETQPLPRIVQSEEPKPAVPIPPATPPDASAGETLHASEVSLEAHLPRSPLRRAIVLREILGPPKSIEAGEPYGLQV